MIRVSKSLLRACTRQFSTYPYQSVEFLDARIVEIRHNIQASYSLMPPLTKRVPASLTANIKRLAKEGHLIIRILNELHGGASPVQRQLAMKREAERMEKARQERYQRQLAERQKMMDAVAI